MSIELIHTSAPRGLDPGSKGFCTVATTEGAGRAVVKRLEDTSAYTPAFKLSDERAGENPVNFAHSPLRIDGEPRNLLSRIAFCGADYSGRSNRIAHHLLLEPDERHPAGPARLARRLEALGRWRTDWEGEPRTLPPRDVLDELEGVAPEPGPAETWERVAGDAGWAGELVRAWAEGPDVPAFVVFEAGTDVPALVEEAMAILPPEARWQVGFSTYYTTLPAGCRYHWRAVLAGSKAMREIRRFPNATVIDLTEALGAPPETPFTEAARRGTVISLPEAPTAAASTGGPNARPVAGPAPSAVPLEPSGRPTVSGEGPPRPTGTKTPWWAWAAVVVAVASLVFAIVSLIQHRATGRKLAAAPREWQQKEREIARDSVLAATARAGVKSHKDSTRRDLIEIGRLHGYRSPEWRAERADEIAEDAAFAARAARQEAEDAINSLRNSAIADAHREKLRSLATEAEEAAEKVAAIRDRIKADAAAARAKDETDEPNGSDNPKTTPENVTEAPASGDESHADPPPETTEVAAVVASRTRYVANGWTPTPVEPVREGRRWLFPVGAADTLLRFPAAELGIYKVGYEAHAVEVKRSSVGGIGGSPALLCRLLDTPDGRVLEVERVADEVPEAAGWLVFEAVERTDDRHRLYQCALDPLKPGNPAEHVLGFGCVATTGGKHELRREGTFSIDYPWPEALILHEVGSGENKRLVGNERATTLRWQPSVGPSPPSNGEIVLGIATTETDGHLEGRVTSNLVDSLAPVAEAVIDLRDDLADVTRRRRQTEGKLEELRTRGKHSRNPNEVRRLLVEIKRGEAGIKKLEREEREKRRQLDELIETVRVRLEGARDAARTAGPIEIRDPWGRTLARVEIDFGSAKPDDLVEQVEHEIDKKAGGERD